MNGLFEESKRGKSNKQPLGRRRRPFENLWNGMGANLS
jgi:hypothetical protein